MALIKCTECKDKISDKAESCPTCGSPVKKKTSGCTLVITAGLIFFIGMAIVGSMNRTPSSTSTSNPAPQATQKKPRAPAPEYSIISDTHVADAKRSVDVRIPQKLSEASLIQIATAIKESDPIDYKRTFIVYYLPENTVGSGGWATSHYNPDLQVQIHGNDASDTPAPLAKEESEIVGRWEYTTFPGAVYTILRTPNGI